MNTRRLTGRAVACSLLALGVALAMSSQASATVTFGSLTTDASASAEADPTGSGTSTSFATGDDPESTTSLPIGGFVSASLALSSATAFTPSIASQAEASDTETVLANFADASSGSVEFQGSTTAKVLTPGAGAFAGNTFEDFFAYTFTVDAESAVAVSYNLTNDSVLGTQLSPGYTIQVYDGAFNSYLSDPSLQNVTGLVTSDKLAPGTYTVEIDNGGDNDFSSASTVGLSGSSNVGEFDFAISPVPEPATWMTMLLGFGAAGGMMRRSRRAKAAAVVA